METKTDDFFTQKLKVGDLSTHSWEYCKQLCIDKKVLDKWLKDNNAI